MVTKGICNKPLHIFIIIIIFIVVIYFLVTFALSS